MRTQDELVRHGTIVLLGTLGANSLQYVFHFAMSRMLGVAEYGAMLGFFALIVLAAIPALVAQTLVAKIVAGFVDEHRIDRIRHFLRPTLTLASIIALLAAAALLVARAELATFLQSTNAYGVVIVAWALVFYVIGPILNGVLQGEQRFKALAICLAADAIVRALLAVVLVAAGYGVNGALTATAAGATVATFLSAALVIDSLRSPTVGRETLIDTYTFRGSLKMSAGLLVISLLASIDVVLVKHYRTDFDAGLFGALSLVGRIVYLIASFVPTIVLPKAAARVSEGQSPLPLLLQATLVFLLTLALVLVPMLTIPAVIMRLIAGADYTSAGSLLATYAIAIAFLAAAYAAANYKIGIDRYGFVVPVCIAGGAELIAIALHHESLTTIVQILAVGHFVVFCATIFRIWIFNPVDKRADRAFSR